MKHKNIKLTPLLDTICYKEISDEEYFSPAYAKYISNSKLALINPDQDGSPTIYSEGMSKHSKYSDALVFGSAVHELVLQPESFAVIDNIDRPTAKMGFMADVLYPSFLFSSSYTVSDAAIIAASDKIDYYKGKMDDKKMQNVRDKCTKYWKDRCNYEHECSDDSKSPIYLDANNRNRLDLCLKSVESNKQIQDLLHPISFLEEPISANEAALFMDVLAEDGTNSVILPLKAKLDNFTVDFDLESVVLNDLKTTGKWLTEFAGSFKKFHYSRQMAMYTWLLKLYVERTYSMTIKSLTSNMLVVCTVPDYRSGVFTVSNADIAQGFSEMKDLLQRVAYLELYGAVHD